jgi:hypothetical protein
MSALARWAALVIGAVVLLGCGDDDDGGDPGGAAGTPGKGGAGGGGPAGAGGSGGGGPAGAGGSAGTGGGLSGAGGSGGSGSSGSAGGATGAPDLIGAWKGDCQPASQGQSFSLAFDIGKDAWALDYVVYGDATCAGEFLTVRIEGPYEITGPSAGVAGAFEARFAFGTKTITPANGAAAGFLGSPAACGGGSWAAGQATEVLSIGCPGLGQYPQAQCGADYDVVSRTGDELRFGARPADNNMCTADRRPTALSAAPVRRVK